MQSRGDRTRVVDWAQSSALLVRREAAESVGYMDPEFFVYYDECDFCRRLAEAGHHTLYVPGAEAVHHDQLSTDLAAGLPRIVEFHRNRDLYMRKHGSPLGALAVRVLTAWSYAVRAAVAAIVPGRPGPRLLGPRPPGAVSRIAVRSLRDRARRRQLVESSSQRATSAASGIEPSTAGCSRLAAVNMPTRATG